MRNLKRGSIVTVISSRHHEVMIGTKGRVTQKLEDGYGVRITAPWLIAGTDRHVTVTEARVVWYPKNELK